MEVLIIAKQKSYHKFIYKLNSTFLENANWNLTLPLTKAIENGKYIIFLNDSQILRWIDEINQTQENDQQAKNIKKQIKEIKKLPTSKTTKNKISNLYNQLYHLQYQPDYVYIIMDKKKHYDRANKGFFINNIKYRRLLGTNGGVKKSTITYVNEKIYDEIKQRIDNGRNKKKELVPAKLESYQGLVCSSSIPVSMPKGIIVVKDCIVHFKDNVILLDDSSQGEPKLSYIENYDIEYIDSDGYGLMLPSYSKKINGELNKNYTSAISGVNIRYAWSKGMLFTFDYIDFANKIANSNYIIQDAWGDWRDIRESEVILTTSMLKLWDSYDSWEDFYKNCIKNHYQFSVAKTTPDKLEHVRNTNYQFLQSYDLSNKEIEKLCQPTIDEIKDVLGMDYRKSIAFLNGTHLNENTIDNIENNYIKALMIDKRMIHDPFVIEKIYSMIKKKISMAAKGSIKMNGNFAIVCGDPYSLAQSIFGLPITGLLKSGQVYHKYWIDKQVNEICCFRAPMTCHNNIRKVQVVSNEAMNYWYQYITTGMILNSWDTMCDAMNGQDKDSDADFTTNNAILIKNTLNSPTIMCIQRKATKNIITESDLIKANKLGFGDEIGVTTNHITNMFEKQSHFDKNSKEYKVLDYRIKCGQLYQQNSIDKVKGIISKPMPKYWYDKRQLKIKPEDTNIIKQEKEFNLRIVADKKPYFMKHIYPNLNTAYNKYIKNVNKKCIRMFQISIQELIKKVDKNSEETRFIDYYYKFLPLSLGNCTVNRICWLIENTFNNYLSYPPQKYEFDYSILKSEISYSQKNFKLIFKIYEDYLKEVKHFHSNLQNSMINKDEIEICRQQFINIFKYKCEKVCSNENELCNIVLDICYKTKKSKQFAWDICGDVIINNLLKKNNNMIWYPEVVETNGEFKFDGVEFVMKVKH